MPARHHWRCLVRIEYLDAEMAALWFPSWNPHTAVIYRPPPEGLLAFQGDSHVLCWACIGADSSRDLDPRDWEKAPEPVAEEDV